MQNTIPLRTFSVWKRTDENDPSILIEGMDSNKMVSIEGCDLELSYKIYASTWEEANSIYHLRQGWEPYKPFDQSRCPICNENTYASRDCWKCQTLGTEMQK